MEGIYWLLWITPTWAVAMFLFFFQINILFIIRDIKEHFPYNISIASQQGDLALIGIVLIGVDILKRQSVKTKPWIFQDIQSQVAFFLFCCIIGGVCFLAASNNLDKRKNRRITAADAYHNLFIIPLFIFLLHIVYVFVLFCGNWWENMICGLLFFLWLVTVWFDAKDGRLDQPDWLARHGVSMPLRRTKQYPVFRPGPRD